MHHFTNRKYEVLIVQAYAGADIPADEVNKLCLSLDKVMDIAWVATSLVVVDLHQYKIQYQEGLVKKALTRRDKKPFEFFLAKN
jgi:hypothetical protein